MTIYLADIFCCESSTLKDNKPCSSDIFMKFRDGWKGERVMIRVRTVRTKGQSKPDSNMKKR